MDSGPADNGRDGNGNPYTPRDAGREKRSAMKHVAGILSDRDANSILEKLFHIKARGTTWEMECLCGLVQFVSCMYVLPVVPIQMHEAGFDTTATINTTALTCAVGCLVAGVFANLPFIVAPPTAVSIFYSVYIRQRALALDTGSTAVVMAGMLLMLFGYGPFGRFVTKLIPHSIQAGTAVGIGLITALAGATEIDLVQTGEYTIVDIGPITDKVVIAMCGFIIIAVALFYKVKGAFCITLLFNTFMWWANKGLWPEAVLEVPSVERIEDFASEEDKSLRLLLTFELLFLCVLTLSGLVRSMSDLSGLTRDNGTTPRNRWLFIICGMTTVLSGYLRGPPVLISPESAAGIKAGAKTGLSTCVCGVFFALSTFLSPLMSEVPTVATAPLLLAVGVLLTQNAKKIDWGDINSAFPAFCCLFFIPFTYNILFGVGFGYVAYLSIGVLTGYFVEDFKILCAGLVSARPLTERFLSSETSDGTGGRPSAAKTLSGDVSQPRSSVFSLRSAMDSVDGHVTISEGIYQGDDPAAPPQAPRRSSLFYRPRNSNLSDIKSVDYYDRGSVM